jgi:hypothetical protein
MADFCTKCHREHGFPGEPDIDIIKESSDIDNGYMKGGYVCEGCGLSGIAKDHDGEILVFRRDDEGWVIYRD